jgi:hypothetical protein
MPLMYSVIYTIDVPRPLSIEPYALLTAASFGSSRRVIRNMKNLTKPTNQGDDTVNGVRS